MFNRYTDDRTSISFPESLKVNINDSRTNSGYLSLLEKMRTDIEKNIISTFRLEEKDLWSFGIVIENTIGIYPYVILWKLFNKKEMIYGKFDFDYNDLDHPENLIDKFCKSVGEQLAQELLKHFGEDRKIYEFFYKLKSKTFRDSLC